MPGPDPDRAGRAISTGFGAETTAPPALVCLRDESDDGTIRFALSGELDIATVTEFDEALRTAQQRAELVTLDLRRLHFMDCRGLAVIAAAARRAGEDGGRFRVVRGPPQVHRLFTLTEIDRQIEMIK